MQAIILAAGMGRRLGELTSGNTKCMVSVNGTRLIDRMIGQLAELSLSRIVVVIGYKGQQLREYLEEHYSHLPLVFVENPVYDKTNNIYSLYLAREYMKLDSETLLLESDLIFDPTTLRLLIDAPEPNVALVSKYQSWNDGTMVRIDEECNITSFIPKKFFRYEDTKYYYKTVNIYKFSRDFLINSYMPFVEAYIRVMGENEYYEQVLRVITTFDKIEIKALPMGSLRWYEIDDVQDLRIAETIFADPQTRLHKLQRSYGGYWRYSGLLDFCYLVNPYFPRHRMVEEMKANFEVLLRNYPSGMDINSLLAAKYFGLRQEHTVVGNGAAELIKSLMEREECTVGVVSPTFEEYPNRSGKTEVYHAGNNNFTYSAEDLMGFFEEKDIAMLVVVNPDNPSGNFIPRHDLLRLAEWAEERGIRLLVDESFVDFATDGESQTLLHTELLSRYPHLCVMKSISKSYGVPGLRLGILASSDTELISEIKRDVAIWNINSFAEFYLQVFGKYEEDYIDSCKRIRAERDRFYTDLQKSPLLRVIPSQANYFLCETTGIGSHELSLELLKQSEILIKDCSSKKGIGEDGRQYVRIAVRDREDNDRLLQALEDISKRRS
ncbi:MAG: aminotransferase class I/II-fold pyridoxal phosphate-dependent enzyme [Clostridium sp.]|nr:aminotransferase class I/II-fold pyridoxal phosphate-dependent enzyme [Prevotella sp.]MCM1429779.1 aminotransferase class I/II-fold pyridoxal phosphate-dependent enzyme [Clostridium sp.]MCM1474707.1 aminotransferase class I/II-fold pyridoxal phosphate-dependent enzyme [Muribaculaceae bacterium]